MEPSQYLSAQEAADELGISVSTLYSYVSRGLIRSEATGGKTRARRYFLEDVQKLRERKEARRNPSKIVENALHWGTPVLGSAITLISGDRFYYRGHDVLDLANECTAEQVAALIWTGKLSTEISAFTDPTSSLLSPRCRAVLKEQLAELTPYETWQVLLPLAAADDAAAYDLRPQAVIQTGVRILRLFSAIAVGGQVADASISETLQQGWVPNDPQAASLINAALILCADHELNVSSFTARCVASSGSTPYAVVTAGLAALQGIKHGGYTERVEALLCEVEGAADVGSALASRLKRGDSIPGFGHRLYSNGDPRGKALLALTTAAYSGSPAVKLAQEVVQAAFDLIKDHPTIDFGLVTLTKALNLPAGRAMALFALGRTIGWLGHAIEQYQTDRIIRPRARYVGNRPAE